MSDILFCFNTVSSTSDFLILLCDVKYRHLIFVNAESAISDNHMVLAIPCHVLCLVMTYLA